MHPSHIHTRYSDKQKHKIITRNVERFKDFIYKWDYKLIYFVAKILFAAHIVFFFFFLRTENVAYKNREKKKYLYKL